MNDKFKKRYELNTKRTELISSKNYTQLLSFFVKILWLSRIPILKTNGFWVGMLQLSMLRTLPKFQETLRDLKNKLKNDNLSLSEKDSVEEQILIYYEWIRVYQTITDGLVWRVLKFDRPILRLLSENTAPGHIHPTYADILKKFISSTDIILINDLSRYLRIADITRVTKDNKILLYELKKDGRTIHDMSDVLKNMKNHGAKGVSSQQHRHWTAQMSIINRKISIPVIDGDKVKDEHRADIIDSNIEISNHLKEVNKLIKLATKSGYEQTELEEGYYVEIMAFDTILSDTKNFEENPLVKRMKDLQSKQPVWLNEQNARNIDIESFDSLPPDGLQFPRNLTPQSVLPFSTRDCVRLMMGILKIRVTLNVDILIKRLGENGWNVKEVEHFAQPKKERTLSGEFLPEHPSEDFLILTRLADDGKYNVVLPLTLVLVAMSSYYQIKFIIDASEATEKAGSEKKGSNQFALNFTQEQTVLK